MAKSITRDMVNELVLTVEEFYAQNNAPRAYWMYEKPRTQGEISFNRDAANAMAYLDEHIDPYIKNMSIMEMGRYLYENNVTVGTCGHMAAVTVYIASQLPSLVQNVEHAWIAGFNSAPDTHEFFAMSDGPDISSDVSPSGRGVRIDRDFGSSRNKGTWVVDMWMNGIGCRVAEYSARVANEVRNSERNGLVPCRGDYLRTDGTYVADDICDQLVVSLKKSPLYFEKTELQHQHDLAEQMDRLRLGPSEGAWSNAATVGSDGYQTAQTGTLQPSTAGPSIPAETGEYGGRHRQHRDERNSPPSPGLEASHSQGRGRGQGR
jgi:hypothetical protein